MFAPYKLQSIRLKRSAVQTIPTGVGTNVIYDVPQSTEIDLGCYQYNSTTGIITLLKTGWYHCALTSSWVANAVGNRSQIIVITDPAVYSVRDSILATNPDIILNRMFVGTFRIINLGATIEFRVLQSSGGNLNLNGGINTLVGSVNRLGDL